MQTKTKKQHSKTMRIRNTNITTKCKYLPEKLSGLARFDLMAHVVGRLLATSDELLILQQIHI